MCELEEHTRGRRPAAPTGTRVDTGITAEAREAHLDATIATVAARREEVVRRHVAMIDAMTDTMTEGAEIIMMTAAMTDATGTMTVAARMY